MFCLGQQGFALAQTADLLEVAVGELPVGGEHQLHDHVGAAAEPVGADRDLAEDARPAAGRQLGGHGALAAELVALGGGLDGIGGGVALELGLGGGDAEARLQRLAQLGHQRRGRGGAGGEEAALFAGSLFRMYSMYAERKGWKTEIMNENPTELGGYKEISFMIEGEGAYSRLKFESGVHRVQRVPETESQGRVHTSTVTVAVLPEAEEVEFTLDPADLQIDVFRSSGAGGQKVNKTSSAIRVTYLPTGMVVECQDERSQYKNKDKALKVLRSRLLEEKTAKQNAEIAGERRSQVGTGDRSERIRTYNFPQGRVSDHRIGLTLYKIEAIMNGDLDEIIDALVTADTAEKLKAED